MKIKRIMWTLFFFLVIGQVQFIYAENKQPTKNEIFTFLQEAFVAQLSLAEKYRTQQEVSEILSPFFTEEYQLLFTKEHLFLEPEGVIMYGTDIPDYFIPFYSYNDNTKLLTTLDKIIVYEYFLPQLEGSIIWDQPHYQILTITKTTSGWQISDYEISEAKPEENASND
nr:DUF3993 domain-containing protein [Calidifontibacillus oryziterrae]